MKERFMIGCYDGFFEITRKDLEYVLTLKTDIEIEAFLCGCTTKEVKKWLKWCKNDNKEYCHFCSAITSKGEKCQNTWDDCFDYQTDIHLYLEYVKKHGKEPFGYCKKHSK